MSRAAALLLPLVLALPAAAGGDPKQLHEGWRRYHAVCVHCHGPDGLGSSFAPSLIDPPPQRRRFLEVVRQGLPGRMVGFKDDPNVAPHLEAILAYLQSLRGAR